MAEKKLYTVTVTTELVVLAEDKKGAEDEAKKSLRDLGSYDYDVEAFPMAHLPTGWDMDAIPYGCQGNPDQTIRDWVLHNAAPDYMTGAFKFQPPEKLRGPPSKPGVHTTHEDLRNHFSRSYS